uniref:synaptotagmin-2-like n=1 Tax=Erigeron canadensis TaxID=72917 RepID=UPI001CB98623|nr:synaptotagmin-2-like [Erigeron canadensis]
MVNLKENRKWTSFTNLTKNKIQINDKFPGKLRDILGWKDVPLKDFMPDESKTLTVDLLADGGKHLAQCQVMLEVMYRPYSYDKIPIEIEGVERSLKVIIHKGEDLKGNNHTNPSVRLLFRGEEKETKSVSRSSSPIWRSEFWYSLEKQKLPINELLHLEVVSTTWMGLIYPEECLGHVDINLTDVINKKRINKTYDLINPKSGRLHVELELVTRY